MNDRPVSPNTLPIGGNSDHDDSGSNKNVAMSSSMFYMSPTCVIDQQRQDDVVSRKKRKQTWMIGLPEVPQILNESAHSTTSSSCISLTEDEKKDDTNDLKSKKKKKQVRFDPTTSSKPLQQPEEDEEPLPGPEVDYEQDEHSSWSPSSCWYSKAEIMEFHQVAREQIQTYRKDQQGWIQSFCSDLRVLDPNSRPPPLSHLLQLHAPSDDFDSVRGLHLDASFIQHRRMHGQRILLIQEKLRGSEPSSCAKILRSTSLQTSRSSKTFARWLAHYDHVDIVHMIQKELMSEEGA